MDIRRIGNIPGEVNQPQQKQRVRSDNAASAGDRIQISDSARAAQEASALANLAKAEADISPEKIKEVRQALADGALLSPEAINRLADRLVDLL